MSETPAHAAEKDALPECSCAMTEASMRTCPRHGEEPWVEHVLTEYGTTTCPIEAVRANVDDGECSACGARVIPPAADQGASEMSEHQPVNADNDVPCPRCTGTGKQPGKDISCGACEARRLHLTAENGAPCSYEDRWTDEVGTIPVCTTHGNNSRHVDSDDPSRPCLSVDPYPNDPRFLPPGGTKANYLLDGSPEAVAVVREARGLTRVTPPGQGTG